jgi:magnesium chelatase accessory protein
VNARAAGEGRGERARTAALDWPRDASDWPLRAWSGFVDAGGLRWHVQRSPGSRRQPAAVLIHGTGASTHSWAALAPLIAQDMPVVSMDLPGHAFTSPLPQDDPSLPGLARAVAELIATLKVEVGLLIGHSAGAAIGAQMCLDGTCAPRRLVSLNGAWFPFAGFPGSFFSPMAKLLAMNPLVPQLFAWRAGSDAVIDRLLGATGSRVDPASRAIYARLLRNPQHAAGALAMMACWDLKPLQQRLPQLHTPLQLLVGLQDHMVSPEQARSVRALAPEAQICELPGLGHLAHEEDPVRVWNTLRAPQD